MDTTYFLSKLIDEWRKEYQDLRFPNFDNQLVGNPHSLILLESPGPEVENSKIVSMANDDATARELYRLAKCAFGNDARREVLLWNAIPWFLGKGEKPKKEHLDKAKPLHRQLSQLVEPNLKNIIFLGEHSRALLPFYSGIVSSCRLYGGHHTGRKAQKTLYIDENNALFENLRIIQNNNHA